MASPRELVLVSRPFLIWVVSLAVWLGTATAGARPVRAPKPLHVDGSQLATVYFTHLDFDTGPVQGDTLREEHINLFNDELRHLGYRVPAETVELFRPSSQPIADYYLAGLLTDFECSRQKRTTCGLSIRWSLFHRSTGDLVYGVVVHHEEMKLRRTEPKVAARSLLLGGLHSLLARPKFVEALKGDRLVGRERSATIARCVDNQDTLHLSQTTHQALAWVRSQDQATGGILISPEGYVVTVARLVDERALPVRLYDGSVQNAEVVRVDRARGVALLQLKNPKVPTPCAELPLVRSTDLGFPSPDQGDLEALGVRFEETRDHDPDSGAQSSESDSSSGRRESSWTLDREDPGWVYVGDRAPGKRPPWVVPTLAAGAASLGVGVALLVTHAGLSEESWLVPTGIVASTVGATLLLGTGLIRLHQTSRFRSGSKKNSSTEGAVRIDATVGLGSITLFGKF